MTRVASIKPAAGQTAHPLLRSCSRLTRMLCDSPNVRRFCLAEPSASNAQRRQGARFQTVGSLMGWVVLAWITASCSLLTDFSQLRGGSPGAAGGGGAGGGDGGGGKPPCSTGPVRGDCGAGQKCSLSAASSNTFSCSDSGAASAWSGCSSDADCEDGTSCDEFMKVCKPWCESAADCSPGAACVEARRDDGTSVSELLVCTAHCSLIAPQAVCGFDANCVLVEVEDPSARNEGDCALAGKTKAACACTKVSDCAAGMRCYEGSCQPWCELGTSCPSTSGEACLSGGPISYDGDAFGQCGVEFCQN